MGLASNYNGVYLWCNYMHLIYAVNLGISVYVVKRYISRNIPIILTNLIEETEPMIYNSLKLTAKALGMSNHSLVVAYAVTGKPFKSKNGNNYVLAYKYEQDYLAGLAQYKKRLAWQKAYKASQKTI